MGRAKLRKSTAVFLVGNIQAMIEWYKRLGFEAEHYPPGFAILRRDAIEIFGCWTLARRLGQRS